MSKLRPITVHLPQSLYDFVLEEQELLARGGRKTSISRLISGIVYLYMMEAKFIRAANTWITSKVNFPVLAQVASEELYDRKKK